MINKILVMLCINIIALYILLIDLYKSSLFLLAFLIFISFVFLLVKNIIPIKNNFPKHSLYILASGCELLKLFLAGLFTTLLIQILVVVLYMQTDIKLTVFSIIYATLCLVVIFWNGIIRVYVTSVQLGITKRVLGIVFGWVLGLNIYYLTRIINICLNEVDVESEKILVNREREQDQVCKTKYPILMVHGVFFRDYRYLNYWGRIPSELKKNGATIYYASQQSAASVEACGEEVADKIKSIVEKTGCKKVNIIAHSKGGLDSRVAISKFGANSYVASLTTINTPHKGCIFAEYLLDNIAENFINVIAKSYNKTVLKLGDKDPDFISAVNDLSNSSCLKLNEDILNEPGILYESVGSYCIESKSGKFPLNLSHDFVKSFDGKNDGLVSISSAKWGSNFTLLSPSSKRGITHADMIDLNRENIDGFDVREFYVKLVSSLKDRGY